LKDDFLEKVQLSTKNSGLSAYRLTLDAFFPTLRKRYPEEIVTLDILRFSDALRRSGLSARTVWNRVHSLMSFLKFCGLPTAKLLDHNERPVKPENTPESYDLKDVKTLLDNCNPYNRIVFESFLKLGLREQELAFLEWPDVHWQDCVVTLRNKPELGFTIKTYQGRSIPVEAGLLTRLRAWQLSRPGTRFVFGTSTDRRNTKLLLALKGAVRRAGLNCWKCDTCKSRKECERWFLHRFRATFASIALQKGLDIHAVMKLLGHRDLASTMRYLSRNAEVKTKIDSIFGSI
jgi:integrase